MALISVKSSQDGILNVSTRQILIKAIGLYRPPTSFRAINSFHGILLNTFRKFSFITDPRVNLMNIYDLMMHTACLVM